MKTPVKFTPCKNFPAPDAVYIEGCVEQPCNVFRGMVNNTTISFTPKQDSRTFRPVIKGTVWKLSRYNYLEAQGDPCNYLVDGKCPLNAGTQVTYVLGDNIRKTEFKLNGVLVNYTLYAENGKDVLTCFSVKMNIGDKEKKESQLQIEQLINTA